MAGATQNDDEEMISAINVTPLVDIFLVLLIIFMVTANLFIQQEKKMREIQLTLPTAASGLVPDNPQVPLNVILDRQEKLYLDGTETTLEKIGTEIDRRRESGGDPQAVVSADKDLSWGRITRVIDYLKLKGIGNLAVNVEEQTIDPSATGAGGAPAPGAAGADGTAGAAGTGATGG
ncbi:MAG TPA: biopolymer transporter ExbD [Myxococcota bacterium]|nr:biopolymer transporter ExbD [Myxococcota bacterium]HOA13338.1 biopolymer transporter ExbD [Myxococcota bacterium]HOH77174.1 biopolymer transporter ExbD [Myxococcota bacterium]HPV04283.1 biopolymer transporter ExbD [Myxococcota bacterium]